jgi:hypothetical protein
VFPPKTLGFDAPIVPKGEVLDPARELKPELAKAEAEVCGLSSRTLPNVGFGEDADAFLDMSGSVEVVLVVSNGSLVMISFAHS